MKPFGIAGSSALPPRGTRRGRENLSQAPGEGDAAVPRAPASWWLTILAAGLIALAALTAYYNSFSGPFIHDDEFAIMENRTIHRLWPIWPVFSPPCNGETVSGRPLLNLSLAINYAISGLKVWSYHAANLLIHIGAALLLFGILRRTFLMSSLRHRFGKVAMPLALASALFWTVHPLQTESVTYIVQRAESLAGFFYLLTLYCVVRGAGLRPGTAPFFAAQKPILPSVVPGEKGDCPPWTSLWYAAAVLACLLGMATKEIMATAPLIVLLYDRTFLSGSFREALRRRWGLYEGLAATWGLLAYLVFSSGLIARQSEFGAPDAWHYACTQLGVILDYLRLSVWPSELCLDYRWPVASGLGEILPGALAIGFFLGATVWGLLARRTWGFLGAWFFLILAPTSSVFPLSNLRYEHRMYLSLAAVAVLLSADGYVLWDRLAPRPAEPGPKGTAVRWAVPVAVWTAILLALGAATVARNRDYRSPLVIYQDTIDKNPRNWAAHTNLGNALAAVGRADEAVTHYARALQLKPDDARICNDLGVALAALGRTDEAIGHYRTALRLQPDDPTALNNLGLALTTLGRTNEAVAYYDRALRLKPDYAEAHNNLGSVLLTMGKTSEAIQRWEESLRLKPDYAEAHYNLGIVLSDMGKTGEAIRHCQEALRLKPDYADAHIVLGNVLCDVERIDEAIAHYHEAIRLKPTCAGAYYNLGIALASTGGTNQAIEHYQEALRLKPDFAVVHYNLASALGRIGRTSESIEHYNQFLQYSPNSLEALNDLAWLLATNEPAQGGDPARAVQLAQQARGLRKQENAQDLDTLAAAFAAAGRFAEAIDNAERARRLAASAGQAPLEKAIRGRLELYRARRPYREGSR
jgi:tetratricopeptide (TPR) repeat protein